jgi:hypothetical protein
VTSMYSILRTRIETFYDGYSELAGSPFVSVKTDGLGKYLEQLTL